MVSAWQLPAAVVVCALVAPAVAQPRETESNAVLQEVRLLRQAIEALARAGVGAQIASQRLHIHEQRRITALNELQGVTQQLASIADEIERNARHMQTMQELISSDTDTNRRAERTRTLEYLQQEAQSLTERRQQLTAAQADADQRFALAHAEWEAVSQKLDNLERAVSRQR